MNGGFILLGHQMSSRSKLIQDEYHLVILFLERVRLLLMISLLLTLVVTASFSPSATIPQLVRSLWCSWKSLVLWARYIGGFQDHDY